MIRPFQPTSGLRLKRPAEVTASPLSTKQRHNLKPGDFVFPATEGYPIHDRAHGANALARSAGKPEHAKVKAAVCKRYPDLPGCQT